MLLSARTLQRSSPKRLIRYSRNVNQKERNWELTKNKKKGFWSGNTYMTDLGRVGPEAAFGSEPFTADVAVEGPVFGPLDLRVVIAQMLLQIWQLDKGSSTIRKVAFVGSLTCETKRQTIRKYPNFEKKLYVVTKTSFPQFTKTGASCCHGPCVLVPWSSYKCLGAAIPWWSS